LNEDIYRKNAMAFYVFILLIGLVLFVIGVGWNLKRNMQYYIDYRTEFSSFESTIASGLFNIGLILIIFGIASFLYEHTSRLIPLRNKWKIWINIDVPHNSCILYYLIQYEQI
jgi:predicted acyltransferase